MNISLLLDVWHPHGPTDARQTPRMCVPVANVSVTCHFELQLHMHKMSNISTVSLSTRVEIHAIISPKCSADFNVISVRKPVQKWGQITISCIPHAQWIYAWFPYQPGHNVEIPLCLVIMCFVLVDICEDLCRIRWKYLFLSGDHKELFSLGFHWLGTFHNLPNSSWTFYSNSMTSFQPFLPLELCHKTHIQGNDWLEAPTPFAHLSTSFQDIPFYK